MKHNPFVHRARLFSLSNGTRNNLDSRISMAVGLNNEGVSSLRLRIIHLLATVAIALGWVAVEKRQVHNSVTPYIVVPLTSSFVCESYDNNEVAQH